MVPKLSQGDSKRSQSNAIASPIQTRDPTAKLRSKSHDREPQLAEILFQPVAPDRNSSHHDKNHLRTCLYLCIQNYPRNVSHHRIYLNFPRAASCDRSHWDTILPYRLIRYIPWSQSWPILAQDKVLIVLAIRLQFRINFRIWRTPTSQLVEIIFRPVAPRRNMRK